MKYRGMIWYNILKFWLPVGILLNLITPISTIQNLALQNGSSLSYFMNYVASAYSYTYILCGLAMAVIDARLVYYLWNKSSACAPMVRLVIVADTIGVIALNVAMYVSFGVTDILSIFMSLGLLYLIWIPTYFYMRARFSGLLDQYGTLHSVKPKAIEHKKASISYSNDPFEAVPQKLVGIADQKRRDNIVAMTLCGKLNPYSGNAITTEAEWDNYVQSYYAEKDSAEKMMQENKADESIDQVIELQQQENVENSESERPAFCRKCGKSLRPDSQFCEFCGESIK